jgi:hypothetical protein
MDTQYIKSQSVISIKRIFNGLIKGLPILLLSVCTSLSAQQSDAQSEVEEVEVIGTAQTPPATEIDPEVQKLLKVAGAASDPLAALQSLPGVTFGSDETAPAVRGSAPEDNTFLIDFIPAAYVFHFFGDSIFNENIIRKFDLYPAAYGNRYNNATGAVIDIQLRDPKNQALETTVDYSFLRTGIFVESGITDNQAMYFSYRRSLIDLYLDTGEEEDGITVTRVPVSDDYQFKYVLNQSETSKLSFVASGANDKAGASFSESSEAAARDPDFLGPASITRSFDSQGVIWDLDFADSGSSLKTAFAHSMDETDLDYGTNQFVATTLDITTLKTEFTKPLNESHWLITGGSIALADFNYDFDAKITPCSYFDPDCSTTDAPRYQLKDTQKVMFSDFYVEDEWYITDQWQLTPGVHLSTDDYLNNDFVEARIRTRYHLDESWTLSAATGQYHQFPGIGEVMPTIGNKDLKSPESIHYVIGVEQKISPIWNWKSEVYYKDMKNQVLSLTEGVDADYAKNYSNDATGEAYGMELLVNRNLADDWYGWGSVSISKSERTNERTGETQAFNYDRPVIVNLVANYKINDSWNVGFKWKAQSGALYTPIVGLTPSTTQSGIENPVYGELNSERLPVYHRLDMRIERVGNYTWGSISLFADILNVYGQENIQGYSYAPNGKDLVKPPAGYASNIPVTKEVGIEGFISIGAKVTF